MRVVIAQVQAVEAKASVLCPSAAQAVLRASSAFQVLPPRSLIASVHIQAQAAVALFLAVRLHLLYHLAVALQSLHFHAAPLVAANQNKVQDAAPRVQAQHKAPDLAAPHAAASVTWSIIHVLLVPVLPPVSCP